MTPPEPGTTDDDLLARLVAAEDRWLAVSFRTGPADRPAAQRALDRAYRAAGLPPPEGFHWYPSPVASMTAMVTVSVDSGQPMVWDRLFAAVAAESARLRAALPGPAALVGNTLGGILIDRTWYRVWENVWCAFRNACWAADFSRPYEETVDIVHRSGLPTVHELRERLRAAGATVDPFGVAEGREMCHLGPEDLHARADAVLLAELAGDDASPVLAALADLAGAAGWCWPLERTPVLTERPVALHRDADGRLHHDAGPAVWWPDGFAVWAWHGVPVSRRVVEQPESITDDDIDEEFSEEVAEAVRERREAYRRGRPTR
jgi:hypothetical protein